MLPKLESAVNYHSCKKVAITKHSFFSRSLQEFEKKYNVLELELLDRICTCERFERFLWGKLHIEDWP